jgi:hypothetical protein
MIESKMDSRRNRTRKGGARSGRRGIVQRVYSPFSHLFQATGETVGIGANAARNVVKKSLLGSVNRVGKTWAKHTNKAIHGLVSRRNRQERQSRRNRQERQSRRNRQERR